MRQEWKKTYQAEDCCEFVTFNEAKLGRDVSISSPEVV